MRKKIIMMAFILTFSLLIGCSSKKGPRDYDTFILYKTTQNDGLIKEEYDLPSLATKEVVSKVLDLMKEDSEKGEYVSTFPKEVQIQKTTFDDENITLDFNEKYKEMSTTSEVLLRSALVQTLTQFENVYTVSFTINSEEVINPDGRELTGMTTSDFVQNIGSSIHSTLTADLILYYGNGNGDKLVKTTKSVKYNSNSTIEKLVMDQLLKGPKSKEQEATMPADTTVLNVTVKDKICYVNLSESFLTGAMKVSPEVCVYSIVNSIMVNSTVEKVQISVGGDTNVMFQGIIDLSKPLSDRADIIKE